MRILLTSMGCTGSQNLVWALRRSGRHFIVGADARAEHGALDMVDVSVQVPMGNAPTYIDALEALLVQHRIDQLIVVMEPELRAVSRAAERLRATGAVPVISPAATIDVCASKKRLAEVFRACGLPTPRVVDPLTWTKGPVFVRPDSGTGSVGARIVRSPADAEALLVDPQPMVFTEWINGEEFSIDGFCEQGGNLVHAICRRRDEMRHGLAVRSTVVPMPSERSPLAALCTRLRIYGFFNLQFRRTPDGRNFYFDLNPRLGGAMVLSFAAGLDAPHYLQASLAGIPIEDPHQTRLGLSLRRRWHNLFVSDGDIWEG
jgi:carbamoyl-phosphate synthase large subunit